MAAKPTLGKGPNDIDIQATPAKKMPQTDIVDASGTPIREMSKEEIKAQTKRIKDTYEKRRAESIAIATAKGTQAGHHVTDSKNYSKPVK